VVFAVDGVEGSGKSTLAIQMAFYCDPTLTNKRVVFTPFQFRKAIIDSKPYQAVVYDEAYTGLSSRATMGLINRTLIGMLAEIRQKNLFIFVCMPCFFDLDKYVALWRSRGLFHVYTDENFVRGRFSFYNVDRKKQLFINGKKYYNYSRPTPNFIGRFTSHYAVNEREYRKNKKNSLLEREKKREEKEKRKEIENELFERIMTLEVDIPHTIKQKILGLAQSTYWIKHKQWKEEQELT